MWSKTVTMTSHERHSVSNQKQLGQFVEKLFILTPKNTRKPRVLIFCLGNPRVTDGNAALAWNLYIDVWAFGRFISLATQLFVQRLNWSKQQRHNPIPALLIHCVGNLLLTTGFPSNYVQKVSISWRHSGADYHSAQIQMRSLKHVHIRYRWRKYSST